MSYRVTEFSEENPLTYKYVRLLRYFMMPLGMWPGEVLGENLPFVNYYRMCLQAQCYASIIGHVIYLYSYSSDINMYTNAYNVLSLILAFVTGVRLTMTSMRAYGDIFRNLFMSFHLGHFRNKGKIHEKAFRTVKKISHYYTVYMITAWFIASTLYILSPLYINYKNGYFSSSGSEPTNASFICVVCIKIPGVIDTNGYSLVETIYTIYLANICGISICSTDLLLSLTAFQIVGHIIILNETLKGLPAPKQSNTEEFVKYGEKKIQIVKMYDSDENKIIHEKLVEWVQHHLMILEFVDNVSQFFGPVLGFNYILSLIGGCLLLLQLSAGTNLEIIIRFVPLSLIIFGQLISLSVIFEVIGTQSEMLSDSVYGIPWELMNTKNRRTVNIILHRVQASINVTAMGMVRVGVVTMVSVLKTTFSYYALLKTLNE